MKLSVLAMTAVLALAPTITSAMDEVNLTTLEQPCMVRWNQLCGSLIESLTKANSNLASDVKNFQTKCNTAVKDTQVPTPLLEETYNKNNQELKDLSTKILTEIGRQWGAQPYSNLIGSIHSISNDFRTYIATRSLDKIAVNYPTLIYGEALKSMPTHDFSIPLNILSVFDCAMALPEYFTNAFLHQK